MPVTGGQTAGANPSWGLDAGPWRENLSHKD